MLPIRWALSEGIQVEEWNSFSSTLSQNYACKDNEDGSAVRFLTQQLKPEIRQHLHLAIGHDAFNSNQPEMDETRIHVTVRRGASLDVHYESINQGFAFLFAGSLVIISVVCFLIDLALIFSKRLQAQLNTSAQRTDDNH